MVQQALNSAHDDEPYRTSIMITHRISSVRKCDLICVFSQGYIIESGTHEELMGKCGIYYRMVNHHTESS